jgi:hypothetical protein
MFYNTFYSYASRQAKFVVSGSVVATQTFPAPYAVKISADGAPSHNVAITAGDKAYPTYDANTRSINAPSGTYSTYIWYYKDGTSCAVANPTIDCGPQDNTTQYTNPWPDTAEWTPATSTEKGNVTFYGVEITLNLALDTNHVMMGGSTNSAGNAFVITPSSSGSFISTANTLTITTDSPKGYSLSVSTNQPSSNAHASDMTNLNTAGTYLPATTNTCSWNTTIKAFTNTDDPLSINSYGFTLDSTSLSSQSLCQIPNSNSPLTVKSTTDAEAVGDATTFYYGAKIDLELPAGYYQTNIVYTVVANL